MTKRINVTELGQKCEYVCLETEIKSERAPKINIATLKIQNNG